MVAQVGKKVVIIGAAGKDFHLFNLCFRGKAEAGRVVAFTAAQIPGIDGRKYPASLAGPGYPEGIPILPQSDLATIIRENGVDTAVFAYSDMFYGHKENPQGLYAIAQKVQEAGARFVLPGSCTPPWAENLPVEATMLKSSKPVIAVCASRTGCGKSQTARMLVDHLLQRGIRTVPIRHPMPYGNLEAQRVQRFASVEDMRKHKCTIEEREEYAPYVERGMIVYAGVDYGDILKAAEAEADVIFWDGGNNDTPFYAPDLWITVVDPLRPGHELSYYPGRDNFTLAHVIVINKVNAASPEGISTIVGNIARFNPSAEVVWTDSVVTVQDPSQITGRRVLVVEDGPTVTHGGMSYGAGMVAAREHGAAKIVDPVPHLVGSLKATFKAYPHLKGAGILPAMGYGQQQMADLAATINAARCDVVLFGTPIDLAYTLAEAGYSLNKPVQRVGYESRQIQGPSLLEIVNRALEERGITA